MAIAEQTTIGPAPAIRSPLDRLRSTIRRYVALEGLALAGIIAAIWFWASLALDYGVFRLWAFDWVQEAPRGVRAAVLIAVGVALIVVVVRKVIQRLFVDFRPSALALVLERRFPDVLGDRLITAVELANVDRAERQGYSRQLIEQTVAEATRRLDQAPIHSVFDWSRLRRLGWWLLAATLGVLLLVGAVTAALTRTNPLTDFSLRFRDTAAIWFERNVLLWNTIWPRNAYLELPDFPSSGELRVGRDAAAAPLRVRAVRWLVADPAAPEGWRAMTWADVTPKLLGEPVPSLSEPVEPTERLDVLERRLDPASAAPGAPPISPEDAERLTGLFAKLAARAAEPGMGRRFRRLTIPARVEVSTWGVKTSNDAPLPAGANAEFTGALTDLKESVRFRVRAEDYATAPRSIMLVPPPMLTSLARNEERPAYLYHRPPLDAGPAGLRGLRQLLRDQAVSLSGAISQFGVPIGSNVELIGTVDKDLTRVRLAPTTARASPAAAPQDLALTPDHRGFRHEFRNIESTLDFEIEMTDTDGVRSRRRVQIEALRDPPPIVNVTIDGLRRSGNGYMATPIAMIPIVGTIVDSQGIATAEYAGTVVRLETAAIVGAQAAAAAGAAMTVAPLTPASNWSGLAAVAEVARTLSAAAPAEQAFRFPLTTFEEVRRDRAARDVILSELERRLKSPPPAESPHVQQFEVKPRFEYLDLRDRLPNLKVRDEQLLQPRYRMRLGVTASDFNVETGPGVGQNKEPPFVILIVSEAELLVEIANDERSQHFKMEDTIARLRDARLRLDKIADELPMLDLAGLPTMALRAQEIQDAANKSRDAVQEVLNEYGRLLREMELNRVMPKLVEKVKGEIILPLEGALRQEFVRVEESAEPFRKELEAGRRPSADALKQALDQLIERLGRVMDAMGEIKGINDLIAALRAIEKAQEQDIGGVLRRIKKEKEDELLRRIGDLP